MDGSRPTWRRQPLSASPSRQSLKPSLDSPKVISYLQLDSNLEGPKRIQVVSTSKMPSHKFANGERFSSRSSINDTIEAGFHLVLSPNSLATRVLWDHHTLDDPNRKPRAVGVEYLHGSGLYRADRADRRYNPTTKVIPNKVFAKREVILSGGVFNTPQLLKLSGVGPAQELFRFNIDLVADLPGVGANLMDNQEMPIVRPCPTHRRRVKPGYGVGNGHAAHSTCFHRRPEYADHARDFSV